MHAAVAADFTLQLFARFPRERLALKDRRGGELVAKAKW